MNRSPAKANAQYLRSAGFAHQGVVPGSERSTTAEAARARAAVRASTRLSGRADNGAARLSGVNRGGNRNERIAEPTRGRLNSSTFAHSQNGGAAGATLRNNSVERRSATTASTRGESSLHARTPRTDARSMTQRQSPAVESRTRSSAFARQDTRSTGSRLGGTPEFSRSSGAAAHAYRPNEQRATAQHSLPQYRAPARVESARESRPAFTQRSAPVQRAERMQRSAPVQRSEPPMRAQAQQQVTRAPPPQERAQRSQPPRQMARSAPPREPRGKSANDRKHDNNGGG
jgi:hypothetical protein